MDVVALPPAGLQDTHAFCPTEALQQPLAGRRQLLAGPHGGGLGGLAPRVLQLQAEEPRPEGNRGLGAQAWRECPALQGAHALLLGKLHHGIEALG